VSSARRFRHVLSAELVNNVSTGKEKVKDFLKNRASLLVYRNFLKKHRIEHETRSEIILILQRVAFFVEGSSKNCFFIGSPLPALKLRQVYHPCPDEKGNVIEFSEPPFSNKQILISWKRKSICLNCELVYY